MHCIWHTSCRTTKRNCKKHEYSSFLECYTLLTSNYSSYQYSFFTGMSSSLWSSSVKYPLFLLWIYGNHNPVTHPRNFMRFNPYYLQSKQIFGVLVYKICAIHNCNEWKAEQSHTWKNTGKL